MIHITLESQETWHISVSLKRQMLCTSYNLPVVKNMSNHLSLNFQDRGVLIIAETKDFFFIFFFLLHLGNYKTFRVLFLKAHMLRSESVAASHQVLKHI